MQIAHRVKQAQPKVIPPNPIGSICIRRFPLRQTARQTRPPRRASRSHTSRPPLPTETFTYVYVTLTHTRTRSSLRRSWLDRFGFGWFCSRLSLCMAMGAWAYRPAGLYLGHPVMNGITGL